MNRKFALEILLVFSLAAGLNACSVSKPYQRPPMEAKNLFRTDQLTDSASLFLDSASVAEISWTNFFSDNFLKDYIRKGLENNNDIRIAVKNIDIAGAYVKQASASYAPGLNGSLTYSHQRNSLNSKIPTRDVDNFGLGVGASWEPDIWGKIKSQEKASVATYLQSVEAHKAVTSRLVTTIASMYFQLMAVDAQMAIADETIRTRDSSLQTTRALMQAGIVTAVAVKQTEAQLYEARLLRINLQKQTRVIENTICLLLNEPSHTIERNKLNEQVFPPLLSVGVPAALLSNRPDITQAEFGLINAFELTNVAYSAFFPSLTLTAATGFQAADIEKWVGLHSVFGNIAAGLVQPITNKRQIRTAYEVAKARREQAYLNYKQTLMNAGADVSNALYEYQAQTEAIGLLEQEYNSLKTAVDFSEQLLINGLANYLEVLTARQNVLLSQLNLVNAHLAQLTSVIDLYHALGGGWR